MFIEDHTITIHISDGTETDREDRVSVTETDHRTARGVDWASSLDGHSSYTPTNDKGLVWFGIIVSCHLESVVSVNHDTKLLCVSLPPGTCMCVPVGYHVHVRHNVEGVMVERSYTVVQPLLGTQDTDHRLTQGKVFYLMIKIYTDGAITPWINSLRPGDSIEVSQYEGNFRESRLDGQGDLIMYAAGTGFTPMVGLINHCLSQNTNR
ncbi:cytochrome b5 reductase 4-like [Argopecten irradians]|uniref:cytochrome b5 reductase 4-like n=1 Tax=Argopecten irradians TaxID=31199 RepID=UPI0037142E1D